MNCAIAYKKEKKMGKFLLGMVATFGIMSADLPDLATWQLVIFIVSVGIRWHSGDSFKKMCAYVGIAQAIGLPLFATNWADIYILGSFPTPAIAMFVGIIASYPMEFIEFVKNHARKWSK